MRYFRQRFSEASFYIALDVVVGGITYIASYGEPGLHTGQMLMRILGAMLLANGLVGGPDTMMYWKEAGRRIKAEDERDEAREQLDAERKEARERLDEARKERDEAVAAAREQAFAAREQAVAAAQEQAAAAAREQAAAARERDAEVLREIRELRAEVAELSTERQGRRRQRRPLRTTAEQR